MKNMYEVVTAKIVEQLESGKGLKDWVRPWVYGGPRNFASGHIYKGLLNLMLLGYASLERGFQHQLWASFAQITKAGGSVRAGERATQIVFSKDVSVTTPNTVEPESDTKKIRQTYRLFKLCPVFNVAQSDLNVDKYREKYDANPAPADEACENAEQWIKRIDHKVQFGSDIASYSTSTDIINMPLKEKFISPHQFIAVYSHELIHWAEGAPRLNRLTKCGFGSPEYSKSEIVAELGSALLCADFGIDFNEVQHPAYLQSWLNALKEDPKYIFGVASLSKAACDFLKEKSMT